MCGFLLLARPLAASPHMPLSPLHPQAQAQAPEPEVLVPRQMHRREIGGGEVHAYTFYLGERQFVSLSVNQQGSDVERQGETLDLLGVGWTDMLRENYAGALDYYEFYVNLLMRMHRLNPDRGFAAAALEVSERGRARVLLDLLSEVGIDVRQGLPADLLEREQSLRLMVRFYRNLFKRGMRPSAALQAAQVEMLRDRR